jgi:1,4-alpha-glucan branching enzyme
VSTPVDSLGRRTALIQAAVSRRDMQEAPLKVQFVLDARRARSVAVVGDFNDWDKTATPLERDSTTGIWSTLASVRPGRHVYAFLVDGTVWTLDPNAPRTKDADYGTEQSVMIVGVR